MELDWFTDVAGITGGGISSEAVYAAAKMVWSGVRLNSNMRRHDGPPIVNWVPWQDPNETGAMWALGHGATFEDLFSDGVMQQECGCL
jgi:hypothetical protein